MVIDSPPFILYTQFKSKHGVIVIYLVSLGQNQLLTASDAKTHVFSGTKVVLEHRLCRNCRHITKHGKLVSILLRIHVEVGALCVPMETPIFTIPPCGCSRCYANKMSLKSISLICIMISFNVDKVHSKPLLVVLKRRLNEVILLMRPYKPRSCVIAIMAR